jgi:thiol-disulfide isomerase/thioredoxin
MLLRIDELELRLDAAGITQIQANGIVQGLPSGSLAPAFALPLLNGGAMSLDGLKEFRRPIILIFMDPACGPCDALMPDVAQWQREYGNDITFAIITNGPKNEIENKFRLHGLKFVMLQNNREIAERYQALATPSAIMVNADGFVIRPLAMGSQQIWALLALVVNDAGKVEAARTGNTLVPTESPG